MWQIFVEFTHCIHFQQPGWLWAALLTLPTVAVLLRSNRLTALDRLPEPVGLRRYRHTQASILRRLADGMEQQQVTHGWLRRWAVYALVLVCMHVALAQPYRLGRQLPMPQEYHDTVFVVDTSVSMVLRDYLVAGERVDRMTMLKSVLIHFIEQLQGNRIGLIAYSEQPYTLVPLTADYALLKSMVRRLQSAVLTGRGSDLGKAMLYVLQQYQQQDADKQAQRPVLVLVSDVNRPNRDVDPRAVASYLKQQGFRLHTIGIGASSYQAQETGGAGLIYKPANFSLLKAIAEEGGGQFHWADSVRSLESAMEAIQSVERRKVEAKPEYIKIPLYPWPLLAGLLFLIVMQLWPRRVLPSGSSGRAQA